MSDLFVEAPYRKQRLGSRLLGRFEDRMRSRGVKYIYTWTAGYEAPGFYRKHGDRVFAELEDWYCSGHARIGIQKSL